MFFPPCAQQFSEDLSILKIWFSVAAVVPPSAAVVAYLFARPSIHRCPGGGSDASIGGGSRTLGHRQRPIVFLKSLPSTFSKAATRVVLGRCVFVQYPAYSYSVLNSFGLGRELGMYPYSYPYLGPALSGARPNT